MMYCIYLKQDFLSDFVKFQIQKINYMLDSQKKAAKRQPRF